MYPPITSTQLGVIRILFAAALAYTFDKLLLGDQAFARELHLTTHTLSNFEWVHALAADPRA